MSEPEAASNQADLDALGALEDAPELERIENLLDRYNVFETIGFVNDEAMHSNLLAFLLDPKRNGGLEDLLIKGVLRETLTTAQVTLPPPAFEDLDRVLENLDSMDLGKTLVRREHHFIDVLLTNEDHKLAVILENKIWASEGPGQLDWYHRIIRHTYPGWTVLCVYLKPSGVAPSHGAYVPLSYGTLCDIVDRILEERGATLDLDVKMSVEHYVRMVRRRILGDPEIVRLSQRLYQKHKRAFDLVYRHRPDVQTPIRRVVEDLVREHPGLELDLTAKDNIKFAVKDWDTPALQAADRWTGSGRMLMFVVYNNPESLDLHLSFGPGPEETRQKLFAMAANHDIFVEPRPNTAKAIRDRSWPVIFTRHLLKGEAYEELSQEQRDEEIRERWGEFIEEDLPRIEAALKKETWVWESTGTAEGP